MKVLHQHERPEGVDLEGLEGVGVVHLRWGLFGVEDAGEGEAEVQVVFVLGEEVGRVFGCVADGFLVGYVDAGHVEAGGGAGGAFVEAFEEGILGDFWVGPGCG